MMAASVVTNRREWCVFGMIFMHTRAFVLMWRASCNLHAVPLIRCLPMWYWSSEGDMSLQGDFDLAVRSTKLLHRRSTTRGYIKCKWLADRKNMLARLCIFQIIFVDSRVLGASSIMWLHDIEL